MLMILDKNRAWHFISLHVKAEYLRLSNTHKTELFEFMKETRNKEEYRRAQE
jgi:hypothetical protein